MRYYRVIAIALAIAYTVLAVLPVAAFIVSALFESPGFEWREFFDQAVRAKPLINSILIATCTSVFSAMIGAPLGFLLCRTDLPFRTAALCALVTPLFVPPFLWAGAWQLMGLFYLTGVLGSIIVLTLSLYPIVMLLAAAGFMRINPGCEDKARMDVSEVKVFLRISLPLAAPTVLAGALLVFMIALSDFGVPSLMQVSVYPVAVFTAFSAFFDFRQAAALCLPLVIITGLSAWFCSLPLLKSSFATFSEQTDTRVIKLGSWRSKVSFLVFAWFTISTLLPIIVVSLRSEPTQLSSGIVNTMMWSIFYAIVGATVITSLACAFAWTLSRGILPGSKGWIFLQPFLIGLPSAVIGLGLVALWNQPVLGSVYGTPIMIVLGYLARFFPFALLAFHASYRMLPRDCEEAAMAYSGSFYAIVRNAIIPYLWRPIVLIWAFAFVLCMGELATTILVSPPGLQTIAVHLFTIEANAPLGKIAALSIVVIFSTIVPAWIAIFVALRGEK